MARILLLNGPNLNLLGRREPEIYGATTLEQLTQNLNKISQKLGFELISKQSNAEHELINHIQECLSNSIDAIIINPGAYTHTSIGIRDALLAVKIPFIEVHLSNIFAREDFRRHSYLSDIARGIITGFGVQSYELALYAANQILAESK